MEQSVINWVFTGFGALAGFLLNAIWQSVHDLKIADKELAEKVSGIEVLVAGDYVKKAEFTSVNAELSRALFAKLDRIEDKLDGKADKP